MQKRVGNFHLDSDKILPFRYLLPALVQRKQLLHLSGIQPPFQYPRTKMKLHGLGCEWLQKPFQPHWEALPALKAVSRAQTISCRWTWTPFDICLTYLDFSTCRFTPAAVKVNSSWTGEINGGQCLFLAQRQSKYHIKIEIKYKMSWVLS